MTTWASEVTRMDAVDTTETEPRLPTGLPDDWLFDRDLPCPKCRYNLRMLSTPRCPECGTVFRWQTLLHIACPRCGESLEVVDADECPRCHLALDWKRLLDQVDPSQFKQFEYTQRPVRAAIRTWLAALRPRRFWQGIRLESPPAVRRLRRLRWAACVVCLLGVVTAVLITGSAIRLRLREWTWLLVPLGVAFIQPTVTALALPLFMPTLARFRIRRDQLLRSSTYCASGLVWYGAVLTLAAALAFVDRLFQWFGMRKASGFALYFDPTIFLRVVLGESEGWWRRAVGDALIHFNIAVGSLLCAIAFLWWWRFLYVSMRYYLRLDVLHSLALFFSTQIIGLLVLIYVLLQWRTFAYQIGHALLKWFG